MTTEELSNMVEEMNNVDYWRKRCEKQGFEISELKSKIKTLENENHRILKLYEEEKNRPYNKELEFYRNKVENYECFIDDLTNEKNYWDNRREEYINEKETDRP